MYMCVYAWHARVSVEARLRSASARPRFKVHSRVGSRSGFAPTSLVLRNGCLSPSRSLDTRNDDNNDSYLREMIAQWSRGEGLPRSPIINAAITKTKRKTTLTSSFTRRRRVHWRDDGASCRFLAELYRASWTKANSVRLPVPLRRLAPSRYHLGLSSRIAAIVSADSAAPTSMNISFDEHA